jgi:hypothetical protein
MSIRGGLENDGDLEDGGGLENGDSLDVPAGIRGGQEYSDLIPGIRGGLDGDLEDGGGLENDGDLEDDLENRTRKSDEMIRKYLDDNKVSVGTIAGDGDCFLNAIIQSAIYELNRRNQPSYDLRRMKSTMVRERIVNDLKLALEEE